ncbi:response regulator [candidate division TA06 bacterium]|uniref:Response regulator n=1 Tax=candidate division TA06 bacterium TaxID=2250710 RepID=A0A660SDA9_UNCT6|nr:response regulator [Candidatus Cloacimonadota bacterium]RKX68653.1 MAG: response regulator [candidate division TA06 bacterium]
MSKHKSILFVDDDPSFLEATTNVLESFGYSVIKALNPKKCFETLDKELPDLIILDVMMARIDSGFDVCRKLKTDNRTKGIPILMLTAVDKEYPFDFGKTAGDPDWLPVEDFIDKPVEAMELVEHIRVLLKEK